MTDVDTTTGFDVAAAAGFDAIGVDELRARGSVKWTMFPDALGAFVAEMDFGLAPVVAEALRADLTAGRTGYLPTGARTGLAEATAAWCADRYDWAVPAERVQPLADVLSALALMERHFAEPGPIIVPTPAYMPFLTLLPALGREVVQVSAARVDGRLALDLEGIDAAFAAGARLLVLCNPWNPIGRVLTRDELLAVAEVVDRHGARVFSDDIHAPLVFDGRRHVPYASVSAAAAAHTMTAVSASKAFNLPGLKCAQLVLSNDADAEHFAEVGIEATHGASGLGVTANTVAYREGGPWLDGVLGYLDGNRRRFAELLAERLPEVGHVQPEGTYIAWLDCRPLELGEPPSEFFLREAGVALTDGANCGEAGVDHARLVTATPRPILTQMVDRMAAAVRAR